MSSITKKDIESAIKELYDAMIESVDADAALDHARARKSAAHQRLLLVRQEIHAITFN